MHDIIFHHYPQSPVAEKVRVIFGIKQLNWRSVIIPRLPPKPDLLPLTGGYRQTPVMQIGADVYCDSQCIIRELERRFPQPTLFPGGSQGMAWGVSRWTDELLFKTAMTVVFAAPTASMSDELLRDRLALYYEPGTTRTDLRRQLQDSVADLRAQIGWMDERLSTRKYMLGSEPGLPDALAYYVVWFLRGRYQLGPDFLAEFGFVNRWEEDIQNLGHGLPTDFTAEHALATALVATSTSTATIDPISAGQFHLGQAVEVVTNNGGTTVRGELQALSRETVVIKQQNDSVGTIAIHFPRVGYRLRPDALGV